MKKLKLLRKILRLTGIYKIVTGFVLFVFLAALGIQLVEPGINSYGDALWYTFASFTTIGFGDFYAVTLVGRVITVVLSLYGIVVIALIPGVLVNYFTELTRVRNNESILEFWEKIENLPSLSKEELRQLSEKVKNRKNRV